METSQAIETAKHVLLTAGIVLAAGSLTGFLAKKIRVPDIVLFLLIGIGLGPEIWGLINVNPGSALNQIILIFGASYILFDGGMTVKLKVLKKVWISLLLLSTLGVLIMTFVVGLSAFYIFDIPFVVALLLGAVICATDPAALVPVFKQVHIKERVSNLVMSESALNDAMGAIITITILSFVIGKADFSAWGSLLHLANDAGIGIIIGLISGFLSLVLAAHKRFGFLREYMPLMTLIVVVGGYLGADLAHASGYMAAFVAGLVIGNKKLFGFGGMQPNEEQELNGFVNTASLIMRMFIFILLGSQVNFALLNTYWVGGTLLVAIFMLFARPLTVFICCLPDRRAKWKFKELLFFCWVRETGVIPSAMAGLLLAIGAPHADLIASVTFLAVIITIVAQVTTTKFVGKKLGLLAELPTPNVHKTSKAKSLQKSA